MRRLVWVPILHTAADLGSLAAANARRRAASGTTSSADAHWAHLTRVVPHLPLPWERVLLYQDALPVCGKELDIVQDMAQRGSANHALLLRLLGKGARLMGTEEPALLLEELELARALVEVGGGGDPQGLVSRSADLLARRDRAIAERIGATLPEGGIGLLFLGAAHDPRRWLPADVQVESLEDARRG